MVEVAPAEIPKKTLPSEIRIQGLEKDMVAVCERVQEGGRRSFYSFQGGYEMVVTIESKDLEPVEGGIEGEDFLKKQFVVGIIEYSGKRTDPKKETHLAVDLSSDQPTVSWVDDTPKKWFAPRSLHEESSRTAYANHLMKVCRVLEKNTPLEQISEKAGDLGIAPIFAPELEFGKFAKLGTSDKVEALREASECLVRIIHNQPVLATHVVGRLLEGLKKVELEEVLLHPNMELLADKEVWENEHIIAGPVSRWLAEELAKTELKDEVLMEHPVMEFLDERLPDEKFVETLADLGLLGRLPITRLIEGSKGARQEMGRMEAELAARDKLDDVFLLLAGFGVSVGAAGIYRAVFRGTGIDERVLVVGGMGILAGLIAEIKTFAWSGIHLGIHLDGIRDEIKKRLQEKEEVADLFEQVQILRDQARNKESLNHDQP